uniref:Uncharacterized protein n=1 Tax=Candidatus Kentrum sp. TC TaxID=2126339 RepID=A0A450Z9E5_9GAMM|nr:MAG: hypothetical protein BECKTC1821D_GA0114238_11029 [Candidatus Kentron sp. TC]
MNNRMKKKSGGKIITFDWAIETVSCDKANFDVQEGFLTALLQWGHRYSRHVGEREYAAYQCRQIQSPGSADQGRRGEPDVSPPCEAMERSSWIRGVICKDAAVKCAVLRSLAATLNDLFRIWKITVKMVGFRWLSSHGVLLHWKRREDEAFGDWLEAEKGTC